MLAMRKGGKAPGSLVACPELEHGPAVDKENALNKVSGCRDWRDRCRLRKCNRPAGALEWNRTSWPTLPCADNQLPLPRHSCWTCLPPRRSSTAKDAAEYAGLAYVTDDKPGISRKRSGHGFRYITANGGRLDEPARKRIKALAIPPAWTGVWICPRAPTGSIQATGRDAKGRKRVPLPCALFSEVREGTQYQQHVWLLHEEPPRHPPKKVNDDISRCAACRGRRCSATVVHLLEATLIRVGSDEYAKQQTRATRPRPPVENRRMSRPTAPALRFEFKGKSGKVCAPRVSGRSAHRRGHPRLPGAPGSGALPVRRRRSGETARCHVLRTSTAHSR